jgi:Domain of unknown function (DUF5658)
MQLSAEPQRRYRWMEVVIGALLVLNLLDAVFTLVWVRIGVAREGNVLLRHLVEDHPVLFVLAKTALVALGSLLLWNRRQQPIAAVALLAMFLLYYAVLLYHLSYASGLFLRA